MLQFDVQRAADVCTYTYRQCTIVVRSTAFRSAGLIAVKHPTRVRYSYPIQRIRKHAKEKREKEVSLNYPGRPKTGIDDGSRSIEF